MRRSPMPSVVSTRPYPCFSMLLCPTTKQRISCWCLEGFGDVAAMRIELLGPSREEEYAALVHARSESLVYASLPYRNFLRCVLPTSRDVYLVADDGGRMVGVLPAFLATVEGRGKVLNSLPFFGSHGGVMTARGVEGDRGGRVGLLEGVNGFAGAGRGLFFALI